MLYTSSKMYEFQNSAKTHYKTYVCNVGVPSNKRRYRWATSRSVMLWVSSLSLRSLLQSILKVSSFCREKVVSCRIFSELLTGNSSSRIWKNSPTGSTKASALVVRGMFAVATMSCYGERFIEVGIGSGLFGIVPWCAIVACNAPWKAVVMAMA